MADQQPGGRPGGRPGPAAGQGKILGMNRTTGLIVIAVGAFVVGYFILSKFGKGSSTSGSSGQSGQGGGGGGYWGSGGATQVRVIRQWQGHGHHGGRR